MHPLTAASAQPAPDPEVGARRRLLLTGAALLATAAGALVALLVLAAVVALTMDFLPLWAVEGLVFLLLAGYTYALTTRWLAGGWRLVRAWRDRRRCTVWAILAVRPRRGSRLFWVGLATAALVAVGLPVVGQVFGPSAIAYTTDSVTSADGTTIGYRQLGHGPGVVLVHGGMMAAQNLMELGAALSDQFTVYIPDRRGRGLSGPQGEDSLVKEAQDIQAVLAQTRATKVFGLSFGAIVALETALRTPNIRQLALYEPPIPVPGYPQTAWVDRFDQELARGDIPAAMITASIGTGDQSPLSAMPRALSEKVMRFAIKLDAQTVRPGDVAIGDLVATVHAEAHIVANASEIIERSRDLHADLLLLGGSESHPMLHAPLDALATAAPSASRVEFAGLDHLAADNDGQPATIARALATFFDS